MIYLYRANLSNKSDFVVNFKNLTCLTGFNFHLTQTQRGINFQWKYGNIYPRHFRFTMDHSCHASWERMRQPTTRRIVDSSPGCDIANSNA